MALPLLTVGVEALAHGLRRRDLRRLHRRARDLADETGSPLVIVGSGASRMEHPCGDALDPDLDGDVVTGDGHPGCVEARGCALCGAPPVDLYDIGFARGPTVGWDSYGPIRSAAPARIPVRDGAAVVLVSGGLESAPSEPALIAAWTEVRRAAGSDGRVFVSHARPWARWTAALAGARFSIERAPPDGPLVYRDLRTPRAPLADTRGRR